MQVVYDISVLGLYENDPSSRAGIARVAGQMAQGLANSPEIELAFFAGEGLDVLEGCRAYLEARTDWQNIPLLYGNHARVRRILREWRYSPETVSVPSIRSVVRSGINATTLGELKVGRRIARRFSLWSDPLVYYHLQPKDWRQLSHANIFHSPALPIPHLVRQVKNQQAFLTVYDLITLTHPEYFSDSIIQSMARTFESLRPDDWVLAISEATKNDVCERLKMDPSRVLVTPLAASRELFYECHDKEADTRVRQRYDLPEGNYFLTLNKLEPRKNIVEVIRAFSELIEQEKLRDCYLVLAGGKGWLYDPIFKELELRPEIAKRVRVPGFIADNDLAALYSNALAFVYPSFYEGFGLPPLEAMQCGTPVITSNTSSLPEVVGNAGIMVDPTDRNGLSQAMFDVYEKPDLRQALSRKGLERAEQFNWERCVADTVKAYRFATANPG